MNPGCELLSRSIAAAVARFGVAATDRHRIAVVCRFSQDTHHSLNLFSSSSWVVVGRRIDRRVTFTYRLGRINNRGATGVLPVRCRAAARNLTIPLTAQALIRPHTTRRCAEPSAMDVVSAA